LKPVFIIAIVAVAMIGVMVPSVFSENDDSSENIIYFTVELNKENYKLGDQSYMKITADRYIPNTPFSVYSNDERIDTCTIEEIFLECYVELPIWKVLERSHATGGYSNYNYSYGDSINESYIFDVYYGDYNNNFGKKSVKINFSPNASYHVDFVSKNYALDKFDIGTSYKISELSIRPLGVISWFDDKICKDSDFTLCPVGIKQSFSMDATNSATLEWYIFDNDKSAKLFYSTYFDVLINDPHSGWHRDHFTPYVIPNELGEGTNCDSFDVGKEKVIRQVCLKDNLIISVVEYDRHQKIMEYAIKKINSSTSLKPIAPFVDTSKDPQHYLDRYNNEPSYKQWFDENYPKYSSIYEAIGIDQEDYELKIKANDVRKLINENYVPTSSELDSKWLWVSSGGTDGYSEYCLTLNCDGYSHTTYRPVRDVVNWDQHLDLTILFFEDGDNSFDTHTEVQCEDQGYFDCGRVYHNYQCITPNANYDLREAKRNLTCQSEYFNIIVNEKKTDCDERSLGCGDFENHSADMMKVVLEKIARNSNVELTNNVESTTAYTPEPESTVETKSSEEGGGCLIATATYGSEMSTEVQQLRELRDNQLLNTASGTAFITTFNDIYYSFSPVVADYERGNPYFKEVVKLAITPMISTLSLMENANSESEVLSIGISVIMLNLGMYLGIPAIAIVGIRKIKYP
jgi:hypothetical protein